MCIYALDKQINRSGLQIIQRTFSLRFLFHFYLRLVNGPLRLCALISLYFQGGKPYNTVPNNDPNNLKLLTP